MDIFDPVKYSLEENKFFIRHMGDSPVMVLKDTLPEGVNPVAVQEVLGTVYELEEEKAHRGWEWVGKDRLKSTIETYLTEWIRWKELSARGAPRYPTMHAWDSRGRPHRGGIGSDSGKVTTYFEAETGNRKTFALHLRDQPVEGFVPNWIRPEEPLPDELDVNDESGTVACPLCGWSTGFNADSTTSQNLAKSRVAKHLKTAKKEPDRHRDLWQKLFA